jgi:TPP-dependent pyruvate/acetoin dehydrogenase alpha subunit
MRDHLLRIYKKMLLIRRVEETIAEKYHEGKMRCPTHLSIGQECVSACISICLKSDDFAVSTHRGHAHYIGKGGDLRKMIAEIYGKSTGCSKGKGGSMHLIDLDVNFMGTSAIVGNSIPVGVGLGLSISLKKTQQISVIFLGDGAVEEGVFYESINFAAVKNLPILFVCENNLYSVYSPLSVRQPKERRIHEMVEGIGIKASYADGNDTEATYKILADTIQEIRQGKGPRFIEFSTYRWREHCGPNYDNNIGYRTEQEFLDWKKRDPLESLEKIISNQKLKVSQITNDVESQILDAFNFAENSPFPKKNEAFEGVFAEK